MTFCISTQVGCAMACAFCLTGKMGLVRNLTAGEIVGQVRVLAGALDMRDTPLQHRADGDGRAAAQLRRDDEGAADPRRRARLRAVAAARSRCRPSACCRRSNGWRASRSCRTSRSRCTRRPIVQRGELVPLNRKYGVADIIEACKRFPLKKRSRITFEYVLLAGRQRLAAGCAAAREARSPA